MYNTFSVYWREKKWFKCSLKSVSATQPVWWPVEKLGMNTGRFRVNGDTSAGCDIGFSKWDYLNTSLSIINSLQLPPVLNGVHRSFNSVILWKGMLLEFECVIGCVCVGVEQESITKSWKVRSIFFTHCECINGRETEGEREDSERERQTERDRQRKTELASDCWIHVAHCASKSCEWMKTVLFTLIQPCSFDSNIKFWINTWKTMQLIKSKYCKSCL